MNQWIYLDLGKQISILGIGLLWDDVYYAKTYSIYISVNGIDWEFVYKHYDSSGGFKSFTGNADLRYIGILCTEKNSTLYALREFEVYSDEPSNFYLSPGQSIQDMMNIAIPGDIIYLREGIFPNEQVSIYCSNITLTSYPGETAVIEGIEKSSVGWEGIIQSFDNSNLIIKDIHIKNAVYTGPFDLNTLGYNYAGILIEGGTNIRVENCYLYNTFSAGIHVWHSENVVITNNEVELACNDGAQECITVDSNNFEISYNYVHDNGPGTYGGEGIDAKGCKNGEIFGNIVERNERIGIYIG